jgi:putative FmdB family regulatory protein
MATYEYFCEHCDVVFEREYPFAQNPKKVKCPQCKKMCPRYLGGDMTFVLKGEGWPSKTGRLNSDMRRRQEQAGRKMRKTWGDTKPKLVDQ